MVKVEEGIWIPMARSQEINKRKFGIWIPMGRHEPETKSGARKGKALLSYDDLVLAARQARLCPPAKGNGIWIPMERLNQVAEQVPANLTGAKGIHIDIVHLKKESSIGANIGIPMGLTKKIEPSESSGIWIPMAKLASVSVFKGK